MIFLNKNKFFKRYLPLILSVILLTVGIGAFFIIHNAQPASSAWFSSSAGTWNYRQKITLNHKLVNTATGTTTPLTNFPVEISIAANALTKSVNNGGHVGLDSGNDIVFTSGDGKTKLNHEIESFASTTGAIIAWVKIPSLSSKTDTTIYMYYGNASETGNEQNATGVWDSNYKGVWHMSDNAANTTIKDSTGLNNATNITNTNLRTISGKIGSALTYPGNPDSASVPVNLSSTNKITVEFWLNITNYTGGDLLAGEYSANYNSNNGGFLLDPNDGSNWGVEVKTSGGYNGGQFTRPSTGTFHHYVIEMDLSKGAALNQTVYVDGSTVSVTQDTSGTSAGNFGNYNWYWMSRDENALFLAGNLDDVRISTSIRTADWIKTEYNNQSSPSTFETFGAEETQPSAQINGGWYNAGWSYRKKITIPHSQVSGTSTLSNFPVLISTTQQILSYTSFGGHTASSTGGDILFTMADGQTALNYEIESYASTTGALIAWVQIPSLSPTTDNTIYMYYGNASAPAVPATTAQNVWSNGYKAVYHFPDGTNLSAKDSTINSYNGTIANTTPTDGKIDGAANFNGTNSTISNFSVSLGAGASDITISFWNYVTLAGLQQNSAFSFNSSGSRVQAHTPYNDKVLYWDYGNPTTGRITANYTNYLDSWAYITLVGKGDNSFQAIYINGVLLNSQNTGAAPTGINSLTIGLYGATDEKGKIDDFKVSTTVRPSSWIATEYANQSAPGTFESIAGEETQAVTTFNSTWYSSAWGYRKPIVIDHRKVNQATNTTTPLTNFPVLVSITDTDLKNYASTTGADILFTSSDGKTKLNHEIESYNSATGVLLAWVQIPSLVSTTDTTVYMYFGNATDPNNEQNASAVWDSNYKAVYHLNEANGATALDSTTNGNNLTSTSYPTATANGLFGTAQSFNGTSNFLSKTWTSPAGSMTISAWVNVSSYAGSRNTPLAGFTGYPGIALLTNSNSVITSALTANTVLSGKTTITRGSWWYISGVCDQANNKNHIYVNGVLDDSSSVAFTCGSNSPFIVNQANSTMNAVEDEIRVSYSARTADWIKTEYLNQSSPNKFYALSAANSSQTRPASTPALKSRGGVTFH